MAELEAKTRNKLPAPRTSPNPEARLSHRGQGPCARNAAARAAQAVKAGRMSKAEEARIDRKRPTPS